MTSEFRSVEAFSAKDILVDFKGLPEDHGYMLFKLLAFLLIVWEVVVRTEERDMVARPKAVPQNGFEPPAELVDCDGRCAASFAFGAAARLALLGNSPFQVLVLNASGAYPPRLVLRCRHIVEVVLLRADWTVPFLARSISERTPSCPLDSLPTPHDAVSVLRAFGPVHEHHLSCYGSRRGYSLLTDSCREWS